MGLRRMAGLARLGWRLKRADDALEKETKRMGYYDGRGYYDVRITLWKALRALGAGLASVVIAAAVGYLSDAPAITAALKNAGFADAFVAAVVPLVLAAGAFIRNAAKNLDRDLT